MLRFDCGRRVPCHSWLSDLRLLARSTRLPGHLFPVWVLAARLCPQAPLDLTTRSLLPLLLNLAMLARHTAARHSAGPVSEDSASAANMLVSSIQFSETRSFPIVSYSCPSSILTGVGGDEGTRTPDLLRAREALSQLSYIPFLISDFNRAINPKCPVGLSRLELLTFPLSEGCSNRLSYRPKIALTTKK